MIDKRDDIYMALKATAQKFGFVAEEALDSLAEAADIMVEDPRNESEKRDS